MFPTTFGSTIDDGTSLVPKPGSGGQLPSRAAIPPTSAKEQGGAISGWGHLPASGLRSGVHISPNPHPDVRTPCELSRLRLT